MYSSTMKDSPVFLRSHLSYRLLGAVASQRPGSWKQCWWLVCACSPQVSAWGEAGMYERAGASHAHERYFNHYVFFFCLTVDVNGSLARAALEELANQGLVREARAPHLA